MEYLLLVLITSACITLYTVPALIKVAIMKGLYDNPDDERKIHSKKIPMIGGIIIFAATLFAYSLWYPVETVNEYKYIVASTLLIFFVGVKDDIIGTAPVKKLMAFGIVSSILVLMANIKITSLHGLFGITAIPEYAQIFLSVFTIMVIVNAFNLIDGIDGLAAGIGLIACLAFGFWFFIAGEQSMACLSFSLAGSLMAFLLFNFYPARVFMGDSGSLTIGLIISILAIKLIEFDIATLSNPVLVNMSKPVFVLAVLAFPLYDTLRIFIYRSIKGTSPFSADKKHMHHRLLRLGFSHKSTSIILYGASLIVITLAIMLSSQTTVVQFIVGAITMIAIAQLPFLFNAKKDNEQ